MTRRRDLTDRHDPYAADGARWPWLVAGLLAVLGLIVNVARPTVRSLTASGVVAPPSPSSTSARLAAASDVASFDPGLLATIEAYRAPRLAWLPVLVLVPLAVAWWYARPTGGLVGRLERRTGGDGLWRPTVLAAAAAATVAAAADLAVLPVRAWLGLVHEARWGFRTSTAAGWWRDAALVSVGRWLTVAVTVALVVWAARRWPRSWPARVTVTVGVAAYAVVALHPVVVQPLLLTTQPLPDGDLRDRVTAVAAAAEVDAPVVVADASRRTTRFNAVVVGLGPTEQVVLFDTLLTLPDDQVVALVAHEFAHQRHGDLLRGTALVPALLLPAALGWAALARRRAPGDPAPGGTLRLVPLLVAVGLTAEVLTGPVVAGLSRRVEAAADVASYDLGADPRTAVGLLRTAVVRDLADPSPARWLHTTFGTHPTPEDRIRAAVEAADRAGSAVPGRAWYEEREQGLRHPRAPTSSTEVP